MVTVEGGPIASLAVGTSDDSTFSASYIITQADIDSGSVSNQALARAEGPGGNPADPSDDVTDDSDNDDPTQDDPTVYGFDLNPEISLIKTVTLNDGGDGLQAGDTLEYAFTVSNTGNVTLTDVTIEDEMVTVEGGPIASLAVGTSDDSTFSASYIITQADIDAGSVSNQALARAEGPGGDTEDPTDDVTDDSDNDDPTQNDPTVFEFDVTPAIAIIKSVTLNDGGDGLQAGDSLDYTFTVTNTGNVTLSNVTVTDTQADVQGGPLASLAVGAVDSETFSASYIITQADLDAGEFSNQATASATAPDGTEVSDLSDDDSNLEDSPTLFKFETSPDIRITISASAPVKVTGAQAVDLNRATGAAPRKPAAAPKTVVTAPDKPSATPETSENVSAEASVWTNYSTNLTVTVTNEGNVTLSDVEVTLNLDEAFPAGFIIDPAAFAIDDPSLSIDTSYDGSVQLSLVLDSEAAGQPNRLSVGDNFVITLPLIFDPGFQLNFIVISDTIAQSVGGEVTDTTADDLGDGESSLSIPAEPSLAIDKQVEFTGDNDQNGSVTYADELTYTVTATNTGNVPQNNVVITDLTATPSSLTCEVLLPTETCVLVATHIVTEADVLAGEVRNVAAVTSEEVPEPITDEVVTTVDEGKADLSMSKFIEMALDVDGGGTLTPGDEVLFSLTVNNELVEGVPTTGAAGVVIEDKLGARYEYLSHEVDGTYDPETGRWEVGAVPVGGSAKLTIRAKTTSEGAYENCTQVIENPTPDPDSTVGNFDGTQPAEDDEACAPPTPVLGISSEFGTAVRNVDGNYSVPLTLTLENTGIVDLCTISVIDDLGAVFGADKVISVSKPVTTGRLVANPNFDGVTDTNVLNSTCADSGSFMPGLSDAVIKYNVVVEPTYVDGEARYTHAATTAALSKDIKNPTIIIPVDDVSTDGPEPDPNKDGAPDEAEVNVLVLQDTSAIQVAVDASLPQANDDGTYSTVVRLVVANTGNVTLSDLRLTSDLAAVFPAGYTLDVSAATIDSDLIQLNSAYDGSTDTNVFLLDSVSGFDSSLSVGDDVVVTIPLSFTPGEEQGFTLEAQAHGDSTVGPASDTAADEEGPMAGTVSITPTGVLGVSLQATPTRETQPSADPNARCENAACTTELVINVENSGNTDLSDVNVAPVLGGLSGFPDGTVITIRSVSVTGDLTTADETIESQTFVIGQDPLPSLLTGDESLAPGDSGEVRLVIDFTLPAGTKSEDFDISAEGESVDAINGEPVTDTSNNGTDTDTNGNGPADDSTPTPLKVARQPIIGVVAQSGSNTDDTVMTLVDSGDATLPVSERTLTYETSFQTEITNLGNTDLENVDVVTSLEATFPTLATQPGQPVSVFPESIVVIKVSYDENGNEVLTPLPTAVNTNFDGINDVNLIDRDEVSLAPGESLRITYDVQVEVNYGDTDTLETLQRQTFETQVAANGTDPNTGRTISDLSNDVPEKNLSDLSANEVKSTIDTDGDFDPNEDGENEPTPLNFPAAAEGRMCRDTDGDKQCTDADEALAGWTVTLAKADGTPVLDEQGQPVTLTTDENGYYDIPQVQQGAYVATFYSPQGVAVGTKGGSAKSLSVVNLSFLIDPRGVVYDSLTGEPIAGVKLFLADANGVVLPDVCLSPSAQQGQVTGSVANPSPLGLAPGEYQFLVNANSDPACPTAATEYQIMIDEATIPEGYRPSTLALPQASVVNAMQSPCTADGSPVDAIDTTARCEIATLPTPDISDGLDAYYLRFLLGVGAIDVINNHIPLDPALDGSVLVAKETPKRRVSVGELVPYTVRAENLSPVALNNVTLQDLPPAGFALASESARVRRTGPDGIMDTMDDVVESVSVTGARPVNLGPIAMAVAETVRFEYMMRVGSGVRQGVHTNQATPTRLGEVIGNTGTADIEVVADPLFDLTTILGKVFHDRNENGVQDEGEEGLAGVRIATVKGEWLITDGFGRYSLPGVDPGQNAWGRRMILKVDKASLPAGSVFTTENPRVLRITGGLMNQFDFGVKLPEAQSQPQKRSVIKQRLETKAVTLGPVYFDSAQAIVTDGYIETIQTVLADVKGAKNVRVVVAGNTDSQPLSPRAAEVYSDNYGLAKSRADAVAKILAATLGMSASEFVTHGYGPDKPVADNGTAEGMAKNRRTDISVVYDRMTSEEVLVSGRQVTVQLKEDSLTDGGLSAAGIAVLDQVASVLADPAFDLARIELPQDEVFVDRRAIIYAYLAIKLAETEELMSKLLVVGAQSVSMNPVTSGWRSALALALNLMVAPAMADEAFCVSEALCNNNAVSLLVSDVEPETVAAMGSHAVQVGDTQLWVSSAPGMKAPKLAFRVPSKVLWLDGESAATLPIWVSTNLGDHVKQWTLEVYDNRELHSSAPIATLDGEQFIAGQPVIWDPSVLNDSQRQALDSFAVRFVLTDRAGTRYETIKQHIDVHHADSVELDEELFRDDQTWFEDLADEDHLIANDHNLPGALVTLHGAGLPEGGTLAIGPHRFPVGQSGQLNVPLYHPPGDYTLGVSVFDAGNEWLGSQQLPVSVKGDYFFMVGLVEFTAGKQDVSGNIELLQDDYHHDGSVYMDGRIAYFLKGQILGKYLLTAQLDTEEQELDNLFDDLNRARPEKLFKRIDPDRYYPVYGDDSKIVRDVDTQGKFYVRLDWDRSSALWGNYNTSFTGTELSNYNRSMYGLKVDYRSQAQTALGDDRTTVKLFTSEPATRAARDELNGTGGSLYYLNHADVVLGSAKVMVEVRDRTSERVREQIALIEGQDYEIDEYQGRIILTRPLRSTAGLSVLSIIRDTPLAGDDVVLVVDYEYVPEIGFVGDDMTAGIRAKQWFGDHVAVGITSVDEEMSGGTYSIRGADLTLKATKGTYLTVETSETDARQAIDSAMSLNGGLDFASLANPAASNGGNALAVNARVDLSDFGMDRGYIGLWFRDQDAGFNSMQFSNTSGSDRVTQGIEGFVGVTDAVDLRFRTEQNDYGSTRSDDELGLQMDWRVNSDNTLAVQYLTRTDERAGFETDSDTLGVRATRRMSDDLSVFINAQSVLDSSSDSNMEDMLGMGVNYRATEKLDLNAEYFSDGDSDGARVGVGYRHRENSSTYLNYVTEQGSFAREGITLGQRTEVNNRLKVYSEHRFDRSGRSNVQGESYGISYDFTEKWTLEGDVLFGTTERNGVEQERTAYSATSRYRNEGIQLVNRFEYRIDESNAGQSLDQWVTTNRWNVRYSDNWVVVGKADYSVTEDDSVLAEAARFGEFDLGFAYRPVETNRFNALAMVSYIYDLDPINQNGGMYADEKGVVYSFEGLYALTDSLKVGGKIAHKRSSIRLDRDSGAFIDATTDLRILRARYHLVWKLDALAEYRWLEVDEIGDEKQGGLLGLEVQLSPNFSIGGGYNFTEFNDRLTALDYDAKGWFINISGHF